MEHKTRWIKYEWLLLGSRISKSIVLLKYLCTLKRLTNQIYTRYWKSSTVVRHSYLWLHKVLWQSDGTGNQLARLGTKMHRYSTTPQIKLEDTINEIRYLFIDFGNNLIWNGIHSMMITSSWWGENRKAFYSRKFSILTSNMVITGNCSCSEFSKIRYHNQQDY